MLGQTILHYKILQKLGEGGMGVVYLAEDTKLKRQVAIKFLPNHIASNGEERKRFEIEAQAAAALNHPNIATIYSIEETDSQMLIVMEYLEGKELKDIIRQKKELDTENYMPLPINDIINYAVQIAEGLGAAHKKGIIHRDIKSQNIMITNDGKVKIMDFGLAKVKGGTQLTKVGSTIGTAAYMSPEQIKGEEVDNRTDIFSFGIVLYEMLTGGLPFKGDYEASVIYSLLNEEPTEIENFRTDVSENILSLISLMLMKDRNKRISSFTEIVKLLSGSQIERPFKTEKKKSIAVLYFENMSPDSENEYFCAGITEDLIIDLSRISDLRVISRSDVLPYRNKEIKSKEIGSILKVPFILEGSVRKAGQKIRITARLIDIKSGDHIWAERYDRMFEDIFDIQSEVSAKITEALKLSLSDNERKLLKKKPTENLEAYDFYLRGRDLISKSGKRNTQNSIKMFEKALSVDTNFALAYAGEAEAYSYLYTFYDGNEKWLDKMIESNEKALKIEPDLTEVKFGLGLAFLHQKKFDVALKAFKEIIETKIDFYPAYRWTGYIHDISGNYDEAIEFYKIAARLKPYSEEPFLHLQVAYRRKGDFAESKKYQNEMLKVGEDKLKINPDDTVTLSRIANIYADLGQRDKALKTVEKVLAAAPGDGMAYYNSACVYAQLKMKEQAMKYLKIALDSGWKNIREWVNSDPDFTAYKNDPEFNKVISLQK